MFPPRGAADTLSGAPPGEVPERLNGRDWKSRNGGDLVRGFESPPLRFLEREHRQRERRSCRQVCAVVPALLVRHGAEPDVDLRTDPAVHSGP